MVDERLSRLSSAALLLFSTTVAAGADRVDWRGIAVPAATRACQSQLRDPPSVGATLVDDLRLDAPGVSLRKRVWLNEDFRIDMVQRGGRQTLYFAEFYAVAPPTRPLFRVVLDGSCGVRGGELIEYDAGQPGEPLRMHRFGPDLRPRSEPVPFNPPVPPEATSDVPCTAVALLDTGINYLLPAFEGRLTRASAGGLSGYDFWDGDDRPFDFGLPPSTNDPWLSPFAPPQHGTSLASIFLADAPPDACIAPYRYFPADSRGNVVESIDRIAADGVRLVVIATGRDRPWPEFQSAMRRHPQMLFVAAAGNNGFDLSRRPVYPQAYDEPNLLVVGATEPDGSLWPPTNRGAGLVDLAVPATRLAGFDFSGNPVELTGTSFASPRVAAWAAALGKQQPNLTGSDLHAAILSAAEAVGSRRDGIWTLSAAEFELARKRSR